VIQEAQIPSIINLTMRAAVRITAAMMEAVITEVDVTGAVEEVIID
jgi:hypothetical protein